MHQGVVLKNDIKIYITIYVKIHRYVVNAVVLWLHMLSPYWCLSVALLGSRLPNSATDTPVRTQYMQPHYHRINHTPMYFNININIVFKATH